MPDSGSCCKFSLANGVPGCPLLPLSGQRRRTALNDVNDGAAEVGHDARKKLACSSHSNYHS